MTSVGSYGEIADGLHITPAQRDADEALGRSLRQLAAAVDTREGLLLLHHWTLDGLAYADAIYDSGQGHSTVTQHAGGPSDGVSVLAEAIDRARERLTREEWDG